MVDDELKASVQRYRAILEHAQQLELLLGKNEPGQLRGHTAKLHALQEEAGRQDRELLTDIARDSTRWQSHPLFRERLQLLEQIVEMNDLLLPRIRGMMSVTAAELAQLKDGRVAASGYQQAPVRSQGSVRGVG